MSTELAAIIELLNLRLSAVVGEACIDVNSLHILHFCRQTHLACFKGKLRSVVPLTIFQEKFK